MMKRSLSDGSPPVDIRHATVCRGRTPVLHDVTLRVNAGESTVILGPNGSGKSTLMKLFSRELYPVAHPQTQVQLFGQTDWDIWKLRKWLGIVSADLHADHVEGYSGLDVVLSGFFSSIGLPPNQTPSLWQRAKGYEVLEKLGLAYLQDQAFRHMSTGEQRRILLARALVHEPHMLIFDEPTTGLDVSATQQYLDIVRRFIREGGTVLLATHHIHEIPPEVEHVVFLNNGMILESGLKAHLLTSSKLSNLFGVSLRVVQSMRWFQAFSAQSP